MNYPFEALGELMDYANSFLVKAVTDKDPSRSKAYMDYYDKLNSIRIALDRSYLDDVTFESQTALMKHEITLAYAIIAGLRKENEKLKKTIEAL